MASPSGNSPAVEAQGVTKVYKSFLSKKIQALDGLNLSVQPGEIFGLLGPNGAGKTTLIKILLDICRPTLGSTFLFGINSRKASARRRVGYLPEDHQFPGYLTAMGALELYGSLSGLSIRECRSRGEEALERVGLKDWKKVKARKFSKGMKQRLGIAQAIFHDPDLLLLDEPTDGVDPVGRRAIRDLLLGLSEQGKTIFINSHLLLEVEMICHQVVILHEGKVLKTGKVEELTKTGSEVRVRVGGDLQSALKVVEEVAGAGEIQEDGIHFQAAGEGELDKVVGALGKAGHPIREVTPVKTTLEDIFIDLVETENGAAGGEGGAA
ncbi:MAG: ABC transporter ATP-binding protein [Planctomycetota bacterium]